MRKEGRADGNVLNWSRAPDSNLASQWISQFCPILTTKFAPLAWTYLGLASDFYSLWKEFARSVPFVAPETNALSRHYRLRHNHSKFRLPLLLQNLEYLEWHLSRKHSTNTSTPEVMSFSCELCSSCFSTENDYFWHFGVHLRKNLTVHCVFKECDHMSMELLHHIDPEHMWKHCTFVEWFSVTNWTKVCSSDKYHS